MKSQMLSRFIVGSMICGIFFLAIAGCVSPDTPLHDSSGNQIVNRYSYETAVKHAPPDATDFRECPKNPGWFYFKRGDRH